MWVMAPHIGRVLGRFHHILAHRLMGRQPQILQGRIWVYPLLEYAIAEAGLQEVDTYVSGLQNTAEHFIVTRPIMYMCLVAERRPCSRVAKRC